MSAAPSTETLLRRLAAGGSLSQHEMAAAIDGVMRGQWSTDDIKALLLGLAAKGETVAELTGAATALRRHMTPLGSTRAHVLDTCGTGGGGKGVFNISTCAAIVAAAAGAAVCKHGNRSATSKTGSADVLEQLGVKIDADPAATRRCLDELGLCFCFAQRFHAAMKNVAAARRELGVRTIFNLVGPLCNPAAAPFQLVGVARQELRPLLAEALARLGARRAAVVCGEDGLGEVTLGGATFVTEVRDGALIEQVWTPEDFGVARAELARLQAASAAESAAIARNVLAGQRGPARDITVANAAAALWVTEAESADPGRAALAACAARAAAALDSGAAHAKLRDLAALSHAPPAPELP